MTDMNKQTEALKLALEALQTAHLAVEDDMLADEIQQAITAIREALASEAKEQPAPVAKPRKQEPVQRYSPDGEGGMEVDSLGAWMKFTSPPAQRTWVGLTDEEIWKDDAIMSANSGYGATFDTLRDVVRAVEAKLKEKNTALRSKHDQ